MAAITLCEEGEVSGIIVTSKNTVEVLPISQMNTTSGGDPLHKNNLHLIKRIREIDLKEVPIPISNISESSVKFSKKNNIDRIKNNISHSKQRKIVEMAVFLDSTAYQRYWINTFTFFYAYKRFSEYFENLQSEDAVRDVKNLLLSYINGIKE